MNKTELMAAVAESADVSKKVAEQVFSAFEEKLIDALVRGEKVTIPGFGSFDVSERPARKGRNPATGAEIDIPASKSVRFKAGKGFKDRLEG